MRLIHLLCLMGLLAGCSPAPQPRPRPDCASAPLMQEVPQRLAKCVPVTGDIAAEARHLLEVWQLIQPVSSVTPSSSWGDVRVVDLLPHAGDELVVVYYPKLNEMIWNPQGKLIVLAHRDDVDAWAPVFDAETLALAKTLDGTTWRNWSYWPLAAQDLTGDGRADLLLKAIYNNGHHALFERVIALSAQQTGTGAGGSESASATLHVVLNIDNLGEYARFQAINAGRAVQLQSVHAIGSGGYLTRTYAFDGNVFIKASETRDPPYATVQMIETFRRSVIAPDSPEIDRAYALIAAAITYSSGQAAPHPDEQVLAEVLLLQLEQMALLSRENDDPKKDPNPQSMLYLQYMRGVTRRIWNDALKSAQYVSHAGELYEVVRSAGQGERSGRRQRICDAIQHFISEHPAWLAGMRHATRGLMQIDAADVCVA